MEEEGEILVMDEVDYYGELWAAIREQERLAQARKLIEGLRAIPHESWMKPIACMELLDELMELNGRETALRLLRYQNNLKSDQLEP